MLALAAMIAVVAGLEQAASLKKAPPPELLDKLSVVGVASVAADPLPFCSCTLICGEHSPIRVANAFVENASFGFTVSV